MTTKSNYIFRLDPCGIICILITYLAVFYSDYVVIKWIVLINYYNSLWGSVHAICFNFVVLLLLWSHGRAVVSDPGLVELRGRPKSADDEGESGDKELDEEWSVCGRCESYRPPRAHHCRICKRCVRRMDHHCPWINNCVGQYNQKFFIQFLFYVGLLSIYSSALVIWSWTSGDNCEYCPKDLLTKQAKILHSVLLILESLLFGMFVLAIMIDQLGAVFADETAVEHVKNRHSNSRTTGQQLPRFLHPPKSRMQLLGDVCGRGPVFLWLLPCRSYDSNRVTSRSSSSLQGDYSV